MTEFQTVIAAILLTTWVVSLGASFGSFLNVVVWRMPRGVSVSNSRSHCPKCNSAILARDNIPIVGWIQLRGKCRNCHLPISKRYPSVEGAVAFVWGVLLLLEVIGHGLNLPVEWSVRHRYNWMIEFPNCYLLYVFFNNVVLFYFVFGIALIDWDQFPVPEKLMLFALAVGCGLIFLWPFSMATHPVPESQLSEAYLKKPILESLVKITTGFGAGIIIGILLSPFEHRGSLSKLFTSSSFGIGTLIGVYLGWQAACSVGILASLIWIILKLIPNVTFPKSFPVFLGLIIQLFAWRWLDQIPNWPSQATEFYSVGIVFVAIFTLQSIAQRYLK